MSLHDCLYCNGNGKFIVHETGTIGDSVIECPACDGKGQLRECQCSAFEPFECICGAWDDVDIDEWYADYMMEEE